MPKHLKIIVAVFIIAITVVSVKNTIINPSIDLHNQTTELRNSYEELTQKQVTNYDGYYLAFQDQFEMAHINKEIFLEATDIIMSNRKDGENVAWKWAQENQNIDFNTFSSFYRQLSQFIRERYQDNMIIEQQKQNTVKKYNTMLEVFPNNILNKIVKVKPLVYKRGYVSDEVKKKFN